MKKKILILIVIICLFLVFIGYSIYDIVYLPKIKLIGESDVILNYQEKYHEKGIKATYKDRDITHLVKIIGKVNEQQLGRYKINYKVRINNVEKSIYRNVYVKDREKPKITLIDNKDIYVCDHDNNYEVIDYQVEDNYDHDLKEKVKITKRRDSLIYEVKDSSGNMDRVVKKIHYKDREKPTISLVADTNIFLLVGHNYKELGYTVSDNCDRDLSKKVKITGKVDKDKPGDYEIIYRVKDSKGNQEEQKRIVHVRKKDSPGTVYLTFDDGPKEGTTDQILDILKQKNIKATFFVTSAGPDSLIKREYDEGHSIGLHTSTHDYSYIYSSIENYFMDLESVHNRVMSITGLDSRIIRFPGGSSNTISRRYKKGIMTELTKEIINRGYRYYDWNILSGDAGDTTNPDEIIDNVTKRLRHDQVNIVLMHDIKTYTKDSLERIIDYGKENGFFFDRIEENSNMVMQRVMN